MYLDAAILEETLMSPTASFRGLNRPGKEDDYCICGKPAERWLNEDGSQKEPSPPDMVFAIYVKCDVGFVIHSWEWRNEDIDDQGHPEAWQHNFGERVQ